MVAFAKAAEEDGYHGLVHNAGQTADALSMMVDQAKAEAAIAGEPLVLS